MFFFLPVILRNIKKKALALVSYLLISSFVVKIINRIISLLTWMFFSLSMPYFSFSLNDAVTCKGLPFFLLFRIQVYFKVSFKMEIGYNDFTTIILLYFFLETFVG